MNRRFPIITLATLSLALLAQYAWAATDLSVTFVNPEKYTDASYSSMFANASDRADVQRDIEQHLQTLGERYLAPGDALKIDVLDIDLAGRVEPLRSRVGNDVRVIRDIAWPRMTVRYTLTRGGQTAASREESLSDLNFLSSFNRYSSGDHLRYEKAMLDRWFAERFDSNKSR